jgi:hypothetical protein
LKLTEPADTARRAFCCRGCYEIFHARRCRVCERELAPGPTNRRTCKRASCRAEYRRFKHLFAFAGRKPGLGTRNVERPLRTSIKPGCFWVGREGGGWRWEEFGDGTHWLFNRDGEVEVRLVPTDGLYAVRVSPGLDYGYLSLEEAKQCAISHALARLPLDKNTAARLAKANELPADLPQATEPCMARLSARQRGVPRAVVTSSASGEELIIPIFLRRVAA